MQFVKLPIILPAVCKNIYPLETITDNMICAGFVGKGGKDACQVRFKNTLLIYYGFRFKHVYVYSLPEFVTTTWEFKLKNKLF